jgi:hypothetical protein
LCNTEIEDAIIDYKLGFIFLSVLERIPVFARFTVLDFIDLGGDLNIKVTLDNNEDEYDDPIPYGLHQEVYICISKDRQPKLVTTLLRIEKSRIVTVFFVM